MSKSCDCITKSNKSDEHAFCTVCSVDILVAHVGRQDITMPPYSSQMLITCISQLSGGITEVGKLCCAAWLGLGLRLWLGLGLSQEFASCACTVLRNCAAQFTDCAAAQIAHNICTPFFCTVWC